MRAATPSAVSSLIAKTLERLNPSRIHASERDKDFMISIEDEVAKGFFLKKKKNATFTM